MTSFASSAAIAAPFRRLRRGFALWLVVLALPWHGVAAATMLHAGTPAPSQAAAAAESPCHGEADAAMPADAAGTPEHHASAGKPTGCAACAACCVLAAMSAPLLSPAPRVFAGRVAPHATAPRVAFLTDGPLRPPRLILA